MAGKQEVLVIVVEVINLDVNFLLSEMHGWGGVSNRERSDPLLTRTLPECSGSPATEGWSSRGAVDGSAATVYPNSDYNVLSNNMFGPNLPSERTST